MATQPPAFVQPNLYQLSGDGRHVSFSPSGLDGQAHLSYQDAHQNSTFETKEGTNTMSSGPSPVTW